MPKSIRNLRMTALAAAFAAAAGPATAQVYYTINGSPAPPNIAYMMRANGLPPGAYWLNQATGYWGVVGMAAPLGNIYAGGVAGGASSGSWSECSSNGCVSGNSRTGGGVITDGQGGGAVFLPGGGMVMTPN